MAAPSTFERDLNFSKISLGIGFQLKDKQLETLKSVHEGHDTLAVLPTGFGKSVIFQLLPFLFQSKMEKSVPLICIVVTPLNSIMQDQVQTLVKRGVPSCFLNIEGTGAKTFQPDVAKTRSANEDEEDLESLSIDDVIISSAPMKEVKEGKFCLLYAHPETLVDSEEIGKMLRTNIYKERVCAIVIDEVHMISEWGKDFRKSFQKLGELTCLYTDAAHLALTATATKSEMKRLCDVLEYRNTNFIIQNPDRPNIFLEIRERLPNIYKFQKFDKILEDIISDFSKMLSQYPVTIVYCDSLEAIGYSYVYTEQKLGPSAYTPAEQIPENRIFAQYHKDYADKMKTYIVTELTKPEPKLRLVFASVALGMGLNAPSVSQIIHFRPPTTLEKYFQEIGRAGRSGQSAKAIMYFNKNDVASNRKGFDSSVKDYVCTNQCLRKHLMNYFGFEHTQFNLDTQSLCCSNCRKLHVQS